MGIRTLFCGLVLGTSLIGYSVPAQSQMSSWSVNVRGINMNCTASDGQPVLIVIDPTLDNVGFASVMGTTRVIQLNPNVVANFSDRVAQFWFAHECAHHALPPAMNSETNADCFAIRQMRFFGILKHPAELNAFSWELRNLPGSPMGHLPGPLRAQNIAMCALY